MKNNQGRIPRDYKKPKERLTLQEQAEILLYRFIERNREGYRNEQTLLKDPTANVSARRCPKWQHEIFQTLGVPISPEEMQAYKMKQSQQLSPKQNMETVREEIRKCSQKEKLIPLAA